MAHISPENSNFLDDTVFVEPKLGPYPVSAQWIDLLDRHIGRDDPSKFSRMLCVLQNSRRIDAQTSTPWPCVTLSEGAAEPCTKPVNFCRTARCEPS